MTKVVLKTENSLSENYIFNIFITFLAFWILAIIPIVIVLIIFNTNFKTTTILHLSISVFFVIIYIFKANYYIVFEDRLSTFRAINHRKSANDLLFENLREIQLFDNGTEGVRKVKFFSLHFAQNNKIIKRNVDVRTLPNDEIKKIHTFFKSKVKIIES